MKREYPIFYAKASTVVAAPIVFITTVFYISHSIYEPATKVFPMAIAAFGITAALAGVCFTMASSATENSSVRYAGEKFLHSSLLLIQSVIVIYAKEAIVTLSFFTDHNTLKNIIIGIFGAIVFLVGSTAGITWYWGFSELNRDLWRRWQKRIVTLNEPNNKEKNNKSNKKMTV